MEAAGLTAKDIDGNPIEIAAVVVWKVMDTAEARFEVDNYEDYVHVQSEAALRSASRLESIRRFSTRCIVGPARSCGASTGRSSTS